MMRFLGVHGRAAHSAGLKGLVAVTVLCGLGFVLRADEAWTLEGETQLVQLLRGREAESLAQCLHGKIDFRVRCFDLFSRIDYAGTAVWSGDDCRTEGALTNHGDPKGGGPAPPFTTHVVYIGRRNELLSWTTSSSSRHQVRRWVDLNESLPLYCEVTPSFWFREWERPIADNFIPSFSSGRIEAGRNASLVTLRRIGEGSVTGEFLELVYDLSKGGLLIRGLKHKGPAHGSVRETEWTKDAKGRFYPASYRRGWLAEDGSLRQSTYWVEAEFDNCDLDHRPDGSAFRFESLPLPAGTRVTTQTPRGVSQTVVGGQIPKKETTQERLDAAVERSRGQGFATEPKP